MDKAPRAHVAGTLNGPEVERPPDAYPGVLECRVQPIGFLRPWWQSEGLPPRVSLMRQPAFEAGFRLWQVR